MAAYGSSSAQMCFTDDVAATDKPRSVAEHVDSSLVSAKDKLEFTGVDALLRELAQDVWASCLSRHEPAELGDTHMSLGIQAVENFKTRALRRFLRDAAEPEERHWDVPGLVVSTPRNVLTLTLPGLRLLVMKTPMTDGLHPRLELIGDWGDQSEARRYAARINSQALSGWSPPEPGQLELVQHVVAVRPISNYLVMWSGDPDRPLTAGRLGIPIQGAHPFAAVTKLWWDESETEGTVYDRHARTKSVAFDQQPVVTPKLSLKHEPSTEEHA